MQIGGKLDEMGWGVYEACREQGAIIATGHEHSYSRTATLLNMQDQIVSPDWPEPDVVGVGPGETFAFVSGLGGRSIRYQSRCLPTTYPYGCNGVWASIYSTSQSAQYGALFIVFNIGGDPYKAHAYFKNISGQIIDEFDIFASAAPDDPEPDTTPTPSDPGNGNECQGKSCDPLPDQSNVDCTSELGQHNPHCQTNTIGRYSLPL